MPGVNYYGRWSDHKDFCSCPRSNLHATKFYRVECDFMDRDAKRLANAGRVVVGVGTVALSFIPSFRIRATDAIYAQARNWGEDLTHTALQVHFRCKCGQIMCKTYEILSENEMYNRWGRYMRTYEQEFIGGIRTTAFNDIERVFEGMPKAHHCRHNNCKHWTTEMVRRL